VFRRDSIDNYPSQLKPIHIYTLKFNSYHSLNYTMFSKGVFLFPVFEVKISIHSLFFLYMLQAFCLIHFVSLTFIIKIHDKYMLSRSSLCSLPRTPVTSTFSVINLVTSYLSAINILLLPSQQ